MRLLFLLFILPLIVGSALLGYFISSPGYRGSTETIFYEVRKSVSAKVVATDLAKLNIVSNAWLFYWYGRLTSRSEKIKAADYKFLTSMKPNEVYSILISGISFAEPITIPEGHNIYQIADLLEQYREGLKDDFLKHCFARQTFTGLGLPQAHLMHSLEGYLFPETYLLGRKTTAKEIIQQMVKNYKNIFTPELRSRARFLGLSEHQVITLASIIEKETGAPEERPIISSVFHNRLQKKMRLQTDPTVIYGIRNFDGNIRRKDLAIYTPYNTYLILGLPPGPIANPGKAAILAALYPVPTPYFYFVSKNDGTHRFSTTFQEHLKNVSAYQLDKRAREGKSWRDLGRKKEN